MVTEPEPKREFLRLLELNRKIVFKVVNTYCRRQQDRDELGQEIVSQLWQAFSRYDNARPFSTWMYRIALNVAISQVRSRSRQRLVPLDMHTHDLAEGASNDDELNDQVRELHGFINGLDQLNRALLLLYLEEHSYREIGEILGISETNVATKISRLKARMSSELKSSVYQK